MCLKEIGVGFEISAVKEARAVSLCFDNTMLGKMKYDLIDVKARCLEYKYICMGAIGYIVWM